jgi:hypothetical protein
LGYAGPREAHGRGQQPRRVVALVPARRRAPRREHDLDAVLGGQPVQDLPERDPARLGLRGALLVEPEGLGADQNPTRPAGFRGPSNRPA